MRKLISLLLAISCTFILSSEANSSDKSPYIAVFANPGTKRLSGWDKVKPNFYVESGDWENLDPFLEDVKRKAGRRPLIIDIECHGSPVTGMLVIQYSSFGRDQSDTASMGYVMKKIMARFKDKKNLEVCLEACHSSVCWDKSLNLGATIESEDFHVDSPKEPVPFPVYGVGPTVNVNNFVITQRLVNIRPFFYDLRTYTEGKEPELSKESQDAIVAAFRMLYLWGIFNR
jgi:hypothetical protein